MPFFKNYEFTGHLRLPSMRQPATLKTAISAVIIIAKASKSLVGVACWFNTTTAELPFLVCSHCSLCCARATEVVWCSARSAGLSTCCLCSSRWKDAWPIPPPLPGTRVSGEGAVPPRQTQLGNVGFRQPVYICGWTVRKKTFLSYILCIFCTKPGIHPYPLYTVMATCSK